MPHNDNKPVMYSALEVANLCGVVNQTAINWIRNKHLKAFNTPGGQFRVYPEDLIEFMSSRNIQIPAELREACSQLSNGSKGILIVDDDRGLNTVVAKYLEKNFDSFSVYQAFDGFEAGSIMTEKQPGILLLDLDLPGIDGFDLCRRINESDRFGKPEIIVITALENDEIEGRIKEFGINSFMKKPLDLVHLVDTIRKICEK